jgi:L-lysine exporter family protein LysE/ArgO
MFSSTALLAAVAGLTFGLSLIVAIGAQNAFVLRQGLLRQHRADVVATCTVSDVVLIALGVGGAGAILASSATLTLVARVGGAAFLIAYAAFAARRAWRGGTPDLAESGEPARPPRSRSEPGDRRAADDPVASARSQRVAVLAADDPVASARRQRLAALAADDPVASARRQRLAVRGTTLALTWLNPHVYLDTVLLVGTAANAHGADRWWFAAGTAVGSALWFSALGYGAAALRPIFARPAAWRVLDAGIAAIMLALGISLAVSAV